MDFGNLAGVREAAGAIIKASGQQAVSAPTSPAMQTLRPAAQGQAGNQEANPDIAARVAERRQSIESSRFNALAAGARAFGTPAKEVPTTSPNTGPLPSTPASEPSKQLTTVSM